MLEVNQIERKTRRNKLNSEKDCLIIPGAKSFDDLEKFLDLAKKQRKDDMIKRNKEFIKLPLCFHCFL